VCRRCLSSALPRCAPVPRPVRPAVRCWEQWAGCMKRRAAARQAAAAAVTAFERVHPERADAPVLSKVREGIIAHMRMAADGRQRRDGASSSRSSGGRGGSDAPSVGLAEEDEVPPPPPSPPHAGGSPGSTPLPADERGSAAAGALAEESVNGRRPPPDRCVAGARGRVRLPEGGSVQ